jgi:hypothetical protein
LTKLPINLWIDDSSRAYLSPLIYILGLGEIALKWDGEMINVRHIRIIPGRVINIKSKAMTSYTEDGKLIQGVPGQFVFASMELGAEAIMELPPPMPLVLTVGILVIHIPQQGYLIMSSLILNCIGSYLSQGSFAKLRYKNVASNTSFWLVSFYSLVWFHLEV